MQIKYHRLFQKHYRQRIAPNKNLTARFQARLAIRIEDPLNAILKDHQLIGKFKQYRAFSITGDVRVIYRINDNTIFLYDIGTHNQVN